MLLCWMRDHATQINNCWIGVHRNPEEERAKVSKKGRAGHGECRGKAGIDRGGVGLRQPHYSPPSTSNLERIGHVPILLQGNLQYAVKLQGSYLYILHRKAF
jgi:hypothetical protein